MRVPPNITIVSRTVAGLLLTNQERYPFHHILSIGSPGETTPLGFVTIQETLGPRVLRLEFSDLVLPDLQRAEGLIPPSETHVQSILDWAKDIRPKDEVLIHCHAGISRSAAAAYIVLCQSLGAGNEDQAMDALLRAKDHIMPNGLMVLLADRIMERKNAMIAAFVRRLPLPTEILKAAAFMPA